MKKLIILSILSLATAGCRAEPNAMPSTPETAAEFLQSVKVNVLQSALAPAAATFDRWDELYRSYKQIVEEFVARNTLAQEENKAADNLLQEMHAEWAERVKAKQNYVATSVQEMVKQAEKEAAAARIKTILDAVAEKLKAEPARSVTRLDQREGEFYTQILNGKELQGSIDNYVASMKKIETYITEFMKKEQLSSQENSRAAELLKKAILQAHEAQNLVTLDTLSF